ncbi:guanylate kinase-like protein [Novymonas esmeraldas]|uniref:Guanylate kinase-like protein n=1 Tax=Novymonas esmeraldas TaxID=1808958 RepID=A0AAW0F277_9TRYP
MSASSKASLPGFASVAAVGPARRTASHLADSAKNTVTLKRLVDVLLFVGPSGCGKSTVIHRLQHEWPALFEFSVSHTTRSPRRGEVDGQHYHFVSMEGFQQLIDAGAMVEYSRLSSHAVSPGLSSSSTSSSSTSSTAGLVPPSTAAPHTPAGNLYGTSKTALHTVLGRNRVVLMDTDLLGAINIRRYCEHEVVDSRPVTVSRTPPSVAPSDSAAALTLAPSRLAPQPLDHEHAVSSAGVSASCDATLASSPVDTRTLRCMIIFIAPPSMEVLERRLRERKSETEASLQLRMKVNRRWMQWAKENQSFFDHYIVNDDLALCYAQVKHIVRMEVLKLESSL